MEIRQQLTALHESLTEEQLVSIRTLLSEESWFAYLRLQDEDLDDNDEYTLAIVQFVVSLSDPEAFKALLTDEQREVLDSVEKTLRAQVGF